MQSGSITASEQQPSNKYSIEEVIRALYNVTGENYHIYIPGIKDQLSKTKDPEYKKYLELKAKFE